MKYVLDTNILSLAMVGDEAVCEHLFSLARPDVLLPQPVLAEVQYGLARLPESKRKKRLTRDLKRLMQQAGRAAWSDEVSQIFGQIKAILETRGIPIEDFDVAIAAHALAHDATLVTDNLDHMQRVPDLRVENWRAR